MAANLLPLRPAVVCSSSSLEPNNPRRIPSSSASPKWWSPLFGWSSEPDYVGTSEIQPADGDQNKNRADLESKQARSRFSPGCFTAEKAKQLRMMTSGASSHHDVMYHSAIASRLASDFKKNDNSSAAAADR
ncbi:unnamed protein product [Linum tenue]|uniref:Uncharacterized protein n=1 Tax=Linum tenue TaxID=586396 RepID=A0AAV0HW89_9ROSI|nr:unnamed protein product [Linum tenue]CAI0389576.1 unnamed protein product [Linum tenue]